MLILTVLPKEKWNPAHPDLAGTPECIPYTGSDLKNLLLGVGFHDITIAADPKDEAPSNFSVIGRKP